MKKRIIFILTLLALVCYFCFGTITATAEEATNNNNLTNNSVAENIASPADDSDVNPSVEDDEIPSESQLEIEKLIALLNKNSADEKNFFSNTILPLIISFGASLLFGVGAIVPNIKQKIKYKQLLIKYKALTEQLSDLQTILQSTDPQKISESINNLLGETFLINFNENISKLKIDKEQLTLLMSEIEIANAKLSCLIEGATNAWGKCTPAVSALTEAPTRSIVLAKERENQQLKSFILEKYGEDGEKTIAKITANS